MLKLHLKISSTNYINQCAMQIEIIEQDLSAIENDVAHVEKMHTNILTAPKMADGSLIFAM